jgi:hypothetical protein
MSLITQHPLVLSDPALSALLLITAFSILIVACLLAIHLRDKALREMLEGLEEALSDIPEAQRKDLIALAIRVSKERS